MKKIAPYPEKIKQTFCDDGKVLLFPFDFPFKRPLLTILLWSTYLISRLHLLFYLKYKNTWNKDPCRGRWHSCRRCVQPRWLPGPQPSTIGFNYIQAQSTYIRIVQSCASRHPKYWPSTPLSTQRVCPPPTPKAGGYTFAGRWGVNILEDADIGLASYSLISLRIQVYASSVMSQNLE